MVLNMYKPLIAITMGDPAGIGPEVIIKAYNTSIINECRLLVIGTASVIERYITTSTPSPLKVKAITSVDEWEEGVISVLETGSLGEEWEIGKVSEACGDAAFGYIETSIQLALAQKIDAVVTCPINKEAMQKAGHNYPGHTEIFAEKSGVDNFTMMFKLDTVSVVHVTTHCSLREAIDLIKEKRVYDNIKLLYNALKDLGIENPRIAVGGLNPHAGENGLFGTEDMEQIVPAVKKAQAEGLNVTGPYPPDTVFMSAFRGKFDGVVAMLHDHGFVALKSRDFEQGVNITVGLPIIRTSVGHGTAFDIAGKSEASEKSLLSAIRVATKMALAKKDN